MIGRVRDLLGMIKFSHTLFALPFAERPCLAVYFSRSKPLRWIND